jgi:hypothetical protein
MVEGSHANDIIGPYSTYLEADHDGQKIYEAIEHIPFLAEEWWYNVIQIPEKRSADDAIADLLNRWG